MTMNTDARPRPMQRWAGRAIAPPAWLAWSPAVILLAVAVLLRHVVAANTDVSWLLTVGERLLDGQRLYRDVIEVNLPMAALVYMPGIMLARAFGLNVEDVTDALVFAAILVSLAIAIRIWRKSSVIDAVTAQILLPLAIAVLAILPMQSFGQREHIALVEMLPLLAVFVVRLKGEVPSISTAIVAGCGAAAAVCLKPHFAIAIVLALGWLAIRARSGRVVFLPENLTVATLGGLYAASLIVFFPDFFTVVVPLVRDVYIPVGKSYATLLEKPALPIWAAAVLATLVLRRHGRIDAVCVVLLTTSLGFAAGFMLQRKGWPYHSYPMIALALLALGYALATDAPRAKPDRLLRAGAIVLFALLFARSMVWFDDAVDARSLQASIARLGPNPRLLAITSEPGLGYPLVRALNGTWVSRQQSLWIDAYLNYMRQHDMIGPGRDPVLDAYSDRERAMLIEDIHRVPPTVVLVDNATGTASAWLQSHPDVSVLLKDYRLAETVDGVDILVKRD